MKQKTKASKAKTRTKAITEDLEKQMCNLRASYSRLLGEITKHDLDGHVMFQAMDILRELNDVDENVFILSLQD